MQKRYSLSLSIFRLRISTFSAFGCHSTFAFPTREIVQKPGETQIQRLINN